MLIFTAGSFVGTDPPPKNESSVKPHVVATKNGT